MTVVSFSIASCISNCIDLLALVGMIYSSTNVFPICRDSVPAKAIPRNKLSVQGRSYVASSLVRRRIGHLLSWISLRPSRTANVAWSTAPTVATCPPFTLSVQSVRQLNNQL